MLGFKRLDKVRNEEVYQKVKQVELYETVKKRQLEFIGDIICIENE